MNEKIFFQYSILRYIHDSFTGEFLNVGLAFYCPEIQVFKAKFLHKYSRITATFPEADGELFRRYSSHLQNKTDNITESFIKEKQKLDPELPKKISEILPNILVHDDSSMQFGPIFEGCAEDPDNTFIDLFSRLIEQYLPQEERGTFNEEEIWNLFSGPLKERNAISKLSPIKIKTEVDEIELEHGWKNGRWKAIQPLSFDLVRAGSIHNKARQYLGTNVILSYNQDFAKLYYLLGRPRKDDPSLQSAYDRAKEILKLGIPDSKIELVEEKDMQNFAKRISEEIILDSESH